jgi:hypothetical protein
MAMERAQSFIGRVRGDPSDKPLFDSVKYYLGPLLDKNLRYSVRMALKYHFVLLFSNFDEIA